LLFFYPQVLDDNSITILPEASCAGLAKLKALSLKNNQITGPANEGAESLSDEDKKNAPLPACLFMDTALERLNLVLRYSRHACQCYLFMNTTHLACHTPHLITNYVYCFAVLLRYFNRRATRLEGGSSWRYQGLTPGWNGAPKPNKKTWLCT